MGALQSAPKLATNCIAAFRDVNSRSPVIPHLLAGRLKRRSNLLIGAYRHAKTAHNLHVSCSLYCITYNPRMRTSSKKTTSAVLRSILGIKDFEMAELLQCSRWTIHSIESGRLPLSETLAIKMFHETGISPDWLLAGSPKKAPTTPNGERYTEAHFKRAQTQKVVSDHHSPALFASQFLAFAGLLRSIMAHANGQKALFLPALKIGRFLKTLAKEYGGDASVTSDMHDQIQAIKRDMRLSAQLERRWKRQNQSFRPVHSCPNCGRDFKKLAG